MMKGDYKDMRKAIAAVVRNHVAIKAHFLDDYFDLPTRPFEQVKFPKTTDPAIRWSGYVDRAAAIGLSPSIKADLEKAGYETVRVRLHKVQSERGGYKIEVYVKL